MHVHLLEKDFITFALDTSTKNTGIAVTKWNHKTGEGNVLHVSELPGGKEKTETALSVYFVTLLTVLEELSKEYTPDIVLFETPFSHLNKGTMMKLARVNAVPMMFAGMKNVPVEGFAPSEWRSFLYKHYPRTEKGTYTKEESFNTVSTYIYPFENLEKDNDKADAVGIAFAFYTFLKLGGIRADELKKQKQKAKKSKTTKTTPKKKIAS